MLCIFINIPSLLISLVNGFFGGVEIKHKDAPCHVCKSILAHTAKIEPYINEKLSDNAKLLCRKMSGPFLSLNTLIEPPTKDVRQKYLAHSHPGRKDKRAPQCPQKRRFKEKLSIRRTT